MPDKRHLIRAAAVTAAAAALSVSGAGIASAHVRAHIYGEPATQGEYTAITFRVPNEDAKHGTSKIAVDIDPKYHFGEVSTEPVPGWTAKVTKSKLPEPITTDEGETLKSVVSKVTWTATPGHELEDGQYQEFNVSVGPLPKVDQLVLPTTQTYKNGPVVKWNQPQQPGKPEPDQPAPVVNVAEASGNDAGASGDTRSSDDTARWLGGAGLAVGALGLGAGAGAVARTRKAKP